MNGALRILFLGVVRPLGALLRGRDPLRLRPPAGTNWRKAR